MSNFDKVAMTFNLQHIKIPNLDGINEPYTFNISLQIGAAINYIMTCECIETFERWELKFNDITECDIDISTLSEYQILTYLKVN